jgi:hypothetical protein
MRTAKRPIFEQRAASWEPGRAICPHPTAAVLKTMVDSLPIVQRRWSRFFNNATKSGFVARAILVAATDILFYNRNCFYGIAD